MVDLWMGFNGKSVAILGVTFKLNTDDMRKAPSLMIVTAMVRSAALTPTRKGRGVSHAKHLPVLLKNLLARRYAIWELRCRAPGACRPASEPSSQTAVIPTVPALYRR